MTDAEKHVWETEDGDLVVLVSLPGGAREYVIADVDAATGLWVQSLTERTRSAKRRLDAGEDEESIDAELHLSDEQESELYTRLLAGTLEDLTADGVKWRQVRVIGQIAYGWVARGIDGARNAWESGGVAPKPNRQARRTPASGSKKKASGAAGSRTSTASTRGTSRLK